MAIARVSVLEFDSQEALEHAQKSHKLMRAKVFPHLKCVYASAQVQHLLSTYRFIQAKKLLKLILRTDRNFTKRHLAPP